MTISARPLAYRDAGTPLTGMLHRDQAVPGSRPGILLVHGGAGLDDHANDQAARYAELGYVVLACDMFGDGVAGDRERVINCVTALRDDPALLARRGQAGLAALAATPGSSALLAAVGYCFGGLAVLTMARAGADLAGVVSIHGSLSTPVPAQPGSVRSRVLACHGSRDPHVPLTQVTAFAEEMDRAGADWQLILLGGAMHGFTHSRTAPGQLPGVAYDARADARSFAATRAFLASLAPAGTTGKEVPCPS